MLYIAKVDEAVCYRKIPYSEQEGIVFSFDRRHVLRPEWWNRVVVVSLDSETKRVTSSNLVGKILSCRIETRVACLSYQ